MMKTAYLIIFMVSLSIFFIASYTLPASDFNGDGTDDIAVFRPPNGLWAIRGITRTYFGGWNDEPAPGDYNGNGADEIGIYRSTNNLWAVLGSTRIYYGTGGDIPITGAGGADADWYRSGDNLCALAAGNIGIGTGIPLQKVHIYSTNPRILIEDSWTGNPEVNFRTQHPTYSADWAIYKEYNSGDLRFYNNGIDAMTLEYGTGWLGIGTTNHKARLTVNGTILLQDTGTYNFLPGYSGIWSNGGELYAIDGVGNFTKISPHDPATNEWIFYSKNVKTGRVVRVDMERLVRRVEAITGEKFMVEKWEKPEEIKGAKAAGAGKSGLISKTLSTAKPALKGHPSSGKDAATNQALLRRIRALEDEVSVLKESTSSILK